MIKHSHYVPRNEKLTAGWRGRGGGVICSYPLSVTSMTGYTSSAPLCNGMITDLKWTIYFWHVCIRILDATGYFYKSDQNPDTCIMKYIFIKEAFVEEINTPCGILKILFPSKIWCGVVFQLESWIMGKRIAGDCYERKPPNTTRLFSARRALTLC